MNGTRSIFILSREYPPSTVGGTSTVARNLAIGMTANEWRVHVVTAHVGSEDVREHIDGISVLRVGTGLVYNQGTGLRDQSLRAHRKIHAAAERLAQEVGVPDLLAIPDIFCYPEAARLAQKYSLPLMNVLLQDFRAITPYDRGSHQVTNGVTADREHLLRIEEKALRGSDHTVFISEALRDAIGSYYPDLRAPSQVVHLGIDSSEIAAVEDDLGRIDRRTRLQAVVGPGVPLLVACGRLVPVKGFSVLLEALARLGPVQRPHASPAQPHLALIGVGPEEAHLRRRAAKLGLERHVTFLGDIPRHEALGWMSVADVAVVPSLWESFCYVCAEMMALGRPVVASHVDSLRELIPDDSFGYRVPVVGPSGSRHIGPDALAGCLRAALEHPVEATARGMRARDRIMENFTNERFGQRISTIGIQLIEARAGRIPSDS
ncbi:glycosyltransferase family 4 protein [Streptomyces sp. NPDC060184]|uniref:glycosyltransferase family 4 protein n=1 Tax=Streptomyces sp. NPDC060184 TaxID=3347064 RepID=UPI00364C3D79